MVVFLIVLVTLYAISITALNYCWDADRIGWTAFFVIMSILVLGSIVDVAKRLGDEPPSCPNGQTAVVIYGDPKVVTCATTWEID